MCLHVHAGEPLLYQSGFDQLETCRPSTISVRGWTCETKYNNSPRSRNRHSPCLMGHIAIDILCLLAVNVSAHPRWRTTVLSISIDWRLADRVRLARSVVFISRNGTEQIQKCVIAGTPRPSFTDVRRAQRSRPPSSSSRLGAS